MRKLFTSFSVAVMATVGALSAWAQNANVIYQKTETKLAASDLTNGKLVSIQAVDRNNSGFFAGAGSLSRTFQADGSTVYEIVQADGESTVSFKQVSSGKYLKNPSGSNPNMEFVDDQTQAAKMTVHKADGSDGKQNAANNRSNLLEGTDVESLHRFYVGNYILNCQGVTSNAGWRGGQGGWTTFYIWEVNTASAVNVSVKYTYKGAEVSVVEKALDGSLTYAQQGVSIPTYYGVEGSTTTDLNSNPTQGAVVVIDYTDKESEPHPFKFAPTASESNTFYTLQVRGRYAKYNGEAESANSFVLGDEIVLNDNYKFQFVGNPLQGFLVYNKAAGTGHALSVSNKNVDNAKLNVIGEEVRWRLKKNGEYWYFLLDGTANNYINYRDPYLSTWNHAAAYNSNDEGSRVLFKEADDRPFWTARLNEAKTSFAAAAEAMKSDLPYFSEELYNEKSQAIPTEVDSEEAYNAALEKMWEALAAFLPDEKPAFFRITPLYHNNNKRLTGVLSTEEGHTEDLALVAATDAATDLNTVFYYKDRKLTSVGTAKSITKNAENKITLGDTDEATPVTFSITQNLKYALTFDEVGLKADANSNYTQTGTAAGGWDDFKLTKVTGLPLTICPSGYATFWTPFPLTIAEGYKAYKAAKNQNGSSLVLEEVTGTIPAETAFIVGGEANSVCMLTIADAGTADMSGNQLVGASTSSEATSTTYALLKGESTPSFAKLGEGVKKIAFKAFFSDAAATQTLPLTFGSITAVQAIQSAVPSNAPIYDLAGRRVAQLVKGSLYLQAGKKIVAQ